MNDVVLVALIGVIPQLVLILVGCLLAVRYRRPIGVFLASRAESLSAFGFRIDLTSSDIARAVEARAPAPGFAPAVSSDTPSSRQISDRAAKVAPRIAGRRVLWVDDNPDGNRLERRLLNGLGLFTDVVLSNGSAEDALGAKGEHVDLVISDIERDGFESGLEMIDVVCRLPVSPPLIFYVWKLDPSKGTPTGAFGITNRPDVLLDLVMDALDRLPSDRSLDA